MIKIVLLLVCVNSAISIIVGPSPTLYGNYGPDCFYPMMPKECYECFNTYYYKGTTNEPEKEKLDNVLNCIKESDARECASFYNTCQNSLNSDKYWLVLRPPTELFLRTFRSPEGGIWLHEPLWGSFAHFSEPKAPFWSAFRAPSELFWRAFSKSA